MAADLPDRNHGGQARRLANNVAADSEEQLIHAGLYEGLLDGADALHLGAWDLARKLFPAPRPTPTERRQIQEVLSGYLNGHLLVAVGDAARRRGEPIWPEWMVRLTSTYAVAIASPELQAGLIAPTDKAVLAAHQVACLTAAKLGRPLPEWQTELDFFTWLAVCSGVSLTAELEDRLRRGRERRQQRLDPPAA